MTNSCIARMRGRLVVIILLALACPAAAQPDLGRWFSPRMGQMKYEVKYTGEGYLEQGTSQPGDLGFARQWLQVMGPILQDPNQEISANVGVGAVTSTGDAHLPDTRDRFPRVLYDTVVGTTWRRRLENGWIIGANMQVGSPSDKPFASVEEVSVQGNGFVQIPWREHLSWLVMVNYSNNREFLPNVPIPGVALNYQPSRNLHVIAGVPFSMVRWRPEAADAFELSASYMMIRTLRAKLGYDLLENVQLYAGFDWRNWRYFRHDRLYDHHRLFYYEKRVRMGVQWEINEDLSLDGYGGYSFDRFWFEGPGYDDRDRNRLDVSDGPFVGLNLRWAF